MRSPAPQGHAFRINFPSFQNKFCMAQHSMTKVRLRASLPFTSAQCMHFAQCCLKVGDTSSTRYLWSSFHVPSTLYARSLSGKIRIA